MNTNELHDHFNRIIAARHHDPFQVLGAHDGDSPDQVIIRAFQPHAESIDLLASGQKKAMERIRPEGLFAIELPRAFFPDPGLDPYTYQFAIRFQDGNSLTVNDPYRALPQLGELDRYLFNAGTDYRLYDHLGAHQTMLHQITGTIFRVWAPNAARVSVVGNFNAWDGRVHQMRNLGASGVWELFIPGLAIGELYKYEIRTQAGHILLKADPLQFYGELRPNTASIVYPLDRYTWRDDDWQRHKRETPAYQRPMTIYEVHPGSWQRDPDDPERFLTFKELARELIPYVRKMGFTHIELMPVMEHPLDESWGYQVTATFSLTSRYGTPEEFMYFVDECHQAGIGVILDWVPAHFPRDSHSLACFDGTALYEHADPRRGAHPEWGTLIYNFGRKEVSNYLIANALFWLDKYHIDGLRVDAVASMLYLDYSRKAGEWLPNCHGGRENLEAIEFLRHANSVIFASYPNTLMIAEESTSFYGVSKPTNQGGLGFAFKWNMGWMNDFLAYFSKDPLYRRFHHNSLTFSLMYAFSENFILPLSHDEVVHGKRSLVDKMPGDLWQKFANVRLLLLTMWAHPGKKLLFMGGEFGQWSEWYCKRSLDWHLLEGGEDNPHRQLQDFTAELNHFYLQQPALWQRDFAWQGFKWLDFSDTKNSIISFARFAASGDDHLVVVLNFTPQTLHGYRIGLPSGRSYRQVFRSDEKRFGGTGVGDEEIIKPEKKACGQAEFSARVRIPPLAGFILQPL